MRDEQPPGVSKTEHTDSDNPDYQAAIERAAIQETGESTEQIKAKVFYTETKCNERERE